VQRSGRGSRLPRHCRNRCHDQEGGNAVKIQNLRS
jgi:hypothetical protein